MRPVVKLYTVTTCYIVLIKVTLSRKRCIQGGGHFCTLQYVFCLDLIMQYVFCLDLINYN